MLKVFYVVLVAIILNGCVVQENKATVTTYITPRYQVNINTAPKAELEDMLDGVGLLIAIVKESTGWTKLANGLIVQCGNATNCGIMTGQTISFPVSFTGAYCVFAKNNAIASLNSVTTYFVTDCQKINTSSFKIKGMYSDNGNMSIVGSSDQYMWIAIGF